jgi:predicted kinase
MPLLILPVATSGAGKTHLGNILCQTLKEPLQVIATDDIRIELTNDVSDQSKNSEVFKIAYQRIAENLKNGRHVYFSATNLGPDLEKVASFALTLASDVTILIIYLVASLDVAWCRNNILKDVKNKVNRVNTATVILPNGVPLLERMKQMFADNFIDRHALINRLATPMCSFYVYDHKGVDATSKLVDIVNSKFKTNQ